MWVTEHISLGTLKAGIEKILKFKYEGDIQIRKDSRGNPDIQVSCGCTSAEFKADTKELIVKFTPKKIAKYLEVEGKDSYPTSKTVLVNYISNGEDKKSTLTFSGIVNK